MQRSRLKQQSAVAHASIPRSLFELSIQNRRAPDFGSGLRSYVVNGELCDIGMPLLGSDRDDIGLGSVPIIALIGKDAESCQSDIPGHASPVSSISNRADMPTPW